MVGGTGPCGGGAYHADAPRGAKGSVSGNWKAGALEARVGWLLGEADYTGAQIGVSGDAGADPDSGVPVSLLKWGGSDASRWSGADDPREDGLPSWRGAALTQMAECVKVPLLDRK